MWNVSSCSHLVLFLVAAFTTTADASSDQICSLSNVACNSDDVGVLNLFADGKNQFTVLLVCPCAKCHNAFVHHVQFLLM